MYIDYTCTWMHQYDMLYYIINRMNYSILKLNNKYSLSKNSYGFLRQ